MEARTWEIWVGAYASPEEIGITRLVMDGRTGQIEKANEYGGIENPSFLALNRSGSVLYAISETAEAHGQPGGRMIAYPVEPQSRRLQSGWERLTHGADPCHVSLDPAERWLATANYNGAAVTLYPLELGGKPGDAMVRLRHSGSGPNPQRQEAPHPHSALFNPADGRYLFVADLGLDRIMIYERGEDGVDWTSSGAVSLASADGPRHLAFHPDGKRLFAVNELSSTVTRFVLEAPGRLERRETVPTLPASFTGENTCAEIAVSPDGKFVYVSNRGHDSIAVFRIEAETGELAPAGHVSSRGRTPRHFALTPDGRWLLAANQNSDHLALFLLQPQTGLPVWSGVSVPIRQPVCVRVRPL